VLGGDPNGDREGCCGCVGDKALPAGLNGKVTAPAIGGRESSSDAPKEEDGLNAVIPVGCGWRAEGEAGPEPKGEDGAA